MTICTSIWLATTGACQSLSVLLILIHFGTPSRSHCCTILVAPELLGLLLAFHCHTSSSSVRSINEAENFADSPLGLAFCAVACQQAPRKNIYISIFYCQYTHTSGESNGASCIRNEILDNEMGGTKYLLAFAYKERHHAFVSYLNLKMLTARSSVPLISEHQPMNK